jgi:hypothetical protein
MPLDIAYKRITGRKYMPVYRQNILFAWNQTLLEVLDRKQVSEWIHNYNRQFPLAGQNRNLMMNVTICILDYYLGSFVAGQPLYDGRLLLSVTYVDQDCASPKTPPKWFYRLRKWGLLDAYEFLTIEGEPCVRCDLNLTLGLFSLPTILSITNPHLTLSIHA